MPPNITKRRAVDQVPADGAGDQAEIPATYIEGEPSMSNAHTGKGHVSHAAPGFQDNLQELGDGMTKLKDDVSDVARGAVHAARAGAGALQERAIRTAQAAKEKSLQARNSLQEVIVNRPFTSVGIAIGIGLIGGMLLGRRRD